MNHTKQEANCTEPISRTISEDEIGVTEYVANLPAFNAIIKARFSDFHVNELDLDGNEVVLNDLKVPPTPKIVTETTCDDQIDLSDSNMQDIKEMLEEESSKKFVEIDVTEYDKEQRTSLHTKIKQTFGQAVISTTEQRDSKKIIKCTKYNKNAAPSRRPKWPFPHDYTYFVLFKENVDTIKAALLLSTSLRCHASSIAYAGTKDRRGKTSQLCCIKHKDPQSIFKAASRLQNIFVGNFSFKPDVLKLGHLRGNRFRIVLRQITADEALVEDSLKSVQEKGFLNYYGLQRFGNCQEIPTYEIGKALLRSNFKEACELIMKPRTGDKPFMEKMRQCWWKTKDAREALKILYKTNRSVEAKLLEGFVRYGKNDYINALNNVPRNMRLLYLHSYQSLIFNKIVSRRMKEWGLKLVVGDLVFADSNLEKINIEKGEVLLDAEEVEIDDQPEKIDNGAETPQEEVSIFKSMVKPLTEDDVKSGKYNIFDVVLPLPGHDITYPNNEMNLWYQEYLASDDLSSAKLKQKLKVYSLAGAYRKWLVKPEKMSWYFKKYESATDTLVISDIEKLKHVPEPEDVPDAKLKALIIDFCLPSSAYATMCLRELLKHDTSAFSQSQLDKTLTSQALEKEELEGKRQKRATNESDENVVKIPKLEK